MNPANEFLLQESLRYREFSLFSPVVQKEFLEIPAGGSVEIPNPIEPSFPRGNATVLARDEVGEDVTMGHFVEGEPVFQIVNNLMRRVPFRKYATPGNISSVLRLHMWK